jgi:hypothetical protein
VLVVDKVVVIVVHQSVLDMVVVVVTFVEQTFVVLVLVENLVALDN